MKITFAVDVDNTLLDNDALIAHIASNLRERLPHDVAQRFWMLYEVSRAETGVATPGEAVWRIRRELGEDVGERVAAIVDAADPERFLYPGALAAMANLRSLGTVVVLSDGDASYQPRKVERSGIAAAADDVMVVRRKQDHVEDLVRRHPADRHVFVDDKASVLADIRRRLPAAFLIHVRQGKYAAAPAEERPDLVVPRVDELERLRSEDLLRPAAS